MGQNLAAALHAAHIFPRTGAFAQVFSAVKRNRTQPPADQCQQGVFGEHVFARQRDPARQRHQGEQRIDQGIGVIADEKNGPPRKRIAPLDVNSPKEDPQRNPGEKSEYPIDHPLLQPAARAGRPPAGIAPTR